jgi:hypothetical protein
MKTAGKTLKVVYRPENDKQNKEEEVTQHEKPKARYTRTQVRRLVVPPKETITEKHQEGAEDDSEGTLSDNDTILKARMRLRKRKLKGTKTKKAKAAEPVAEQEEESEDKSDEEGKDEKEKSSPAESEDEEENRNEESDHDMKGNISFIIISTHVNQCFKNTLMF